MDRVRANTQSVQNQFVHCLVQVRTSSMLGVGAQLVNERRSLGTAPWLLLRTRSFMQH